jgi:hypothetical protein
MLLTAATFYDPFEAEIVRARLEAEGIPASTAHYHHVAAYWPLSVALGGVKVQVPAACLADAKDLLDAYQSGALLRSLESAANLVAEVCPICGATRIRNVAPLSGRFALVACFLTIGLIFPLHASRRTCDACGASWRSRV